MGSLGVLFGAALYGYLLAAALYAFWLLWRRKWLWLAATVLLAFGVVAQVVYVAMRGIVSGRPPMADVFETLVVLSACTGGAFLAFSRRREWQAFAPAFGSACFLVTLSAYLLMEEDVRLLVPALRNNLMLTIHVGFCLVSYAAFVFAYVLALAYLARGRESAPVAALIAALTFAIAATAAVVLASGTGARLKSSPAALGAAAGGCVILGVLLWPVVGLVGTRLDLREHLPDRDRLRGLLYATVAFGFPFLSLGIMTGAIWAQQAWGRYWGWDPKETAALVTWLTYAVYLHLNEDHRLREKWSPWAAAAGFWCVLFTYFGVNYLLPSLHSYQ